ncbi:acylphosphatase [Litorilituus lipolyticus]|uniref:acylphosphatase n=1 Tax=Litorilituus lipolyticus TaxID=2491017 RepID=A0A502KSR5_9GAMM|nr:acylphosphatase [Litorilituus lipolyticus]TPH13439.1 acylphosphatase [Litorilituus lipolyticus]
MTSNSIKAIVSGKVQKVWFRANTQKKAQELKVVGHAINLTNGDVEVLAYGDKVQLQTLIDWLHIGSEKSEVKQVAVTELASDELAHLTSFTTG